ncbi:TPA: DNA-binding protein [Candidatus Poribacteria bacterium]|nr:DNA-binding protein [Candidatus Poribacteria bacterium]HEX29770.1 DNA-binding protein [Candidatus Poribacteria bacterium]
MEKEAYSISDIARKLGVTRRTVFNWIKTGQLEVINISLGKKKPTYRITKEALERFIQLRRVKTTQRDLPRRKGAAERILSKSFKLQGLTTDELIRIGREERWKRV